MDQPDNFMTLLTRHRIASGWTQEELARKVGVTPSTISLWESGKWMPHPRRIKRLARVLGIGTMELTRVISPSESELASTAK